jgi:hypothetical protein
MKKSKMGDGRKKKPILSLYENENLKKGDRKRIRKKHTKKTPYPYAKIKKIKKGDGQKKKPFYPCMKMKIS